MRLSERMKGRAGLLVLLALVLAAAGVKAVAESFPFSGVTNADTNMRRTPNSSQSNVIARIPEGDQVTVLSASGNFYRVEYAGQTGYVFKKYVEKGSASSGNQAFTATGYPYATVARDTVSLRKSRSTSATKLASIPEGGTVTVLGLNGSWANVTYDGKTGWCQKDYLRLATIVKATATPAPAPTIVPGEDASSYQVLQSGSDGSQVMALQEALIELGFLRGSADGVYGSATAQAVMAFQRQNGYPITGIVDANLQAFLFNGKPENVDGDKTELKTLPAIEGITVHSGDRGVLVRTIQSRLQTLGYYTGVVNGNYDAATVKAVRAFQKQNGLKQDGICGGDTQTLLLGSGALSSGATPTPAPTPSPTPLPELEKPTGKVSKGSRGADALLVQQRLIDLGYLTGKADGAFGTNSVKALKAFQEKNGLKADGVAGSGTNAVLFSHLALRADYVPTIAPVSTPAANASPAPSYEPVTKENVVVIRQGTTGEAVRRLQQRLTQLGYYNSILDGVCKADDVAAIRAFQRTNKLDVDGVAGYATQVALYASTAIMDNGQMAGGVVDALQTLKKGMTGEAVRQLQERLIKLGYLTGIADGIYGTDTAEAVYNFQKRSGLVRDGVAGAKTLAALYSINAAQPTPPPAPEATRVPASIATNVTLKEGDVSSSVKTMQEKLIALGYLSGSADGNFGPKTYRAVVAFQKANALATDGVAGKQTLAALNSAGISNGGTTGPSASAPTVTTAPGASTGLGTTVRVSAENVIYEQWYSTVRAACRKYPYCTLYDPETGISWQVHMFSYGKHAEIEPLTAADTEKMYQACGYQDWTPKPVWVIFADGTIRIATTHSVPHEVQHITDNNFAGHSCLHFPRTMAQVTAIGPYATRHQNAVDKAWAELQASLK